jgi:prepilin-type N-terminal cleavage/methylation domain-containing protein
MVNLVTLNPCVHRGIKIVRNSLKMKKAFTLIELVVVMGIIAFMAAISGPALGPEINRANLSAATTQIRDLVVQTQALAIAPENRSAVGYVLVLNLNSSAISYGSPSAVTLQKYDYGIFSIIGADRNMVKTGHVSAPVDISCGPSACGGYLDSNMAFKINFRTSDYAAGCSNVYYDTPWGSTCGYSGANNYIEITVTGKTQTKLVRINKITGQTEICLQNGASCEPI